MNESNPRKTRLFAFDVEADGPCPGLYSMVSIGIVEMSSQGLGAQFYGQFKPISDLWIPQALSVSGFSRAQTLQFPDPLLELQRLEQWLGLQSNERAVLVSDNPAFDWQWINYYCHRFLKHNPFGHSARRIGDVYAGFQGKLSETNGWKKWRKTKHTHNALEDAKGVAEGWIALSKNLKTHSSPSSSKF